MIFSNLCVQHLIQSGGERGLGDLLPRQVDADPETLSLVGVQELVVIHRSQYLEAREKGSNTMTSCCGRAVALRSLWIIIGRHLFVVSIISGKPLQAREA